MLDTAFPRIPGDVGCEATFAFPTLRAVVRGATPDAIVHRADATLLPAFLAAAASLIEAGCVGIGTTCGFLVRWQAALCELLPVPVFSSPLLLIGLIERTLPRGRRVGVVTYSADDLDAATLAAAGAAADTPLAGVDPHGYFARVIRGGADTLDASRMATDVVAAARRLVGSHPQIGALVLECANMPPYRGAVARALGLPVFDAAQALAWFHAGLAPGDGAVAPPIYGK